MSIITLSRGKPRRHTARIRWRDLHQYRLSVAVSRQPPRNHIPRTIAQETLQSQLEDLTAFVKSVITSLPPA